ncbi:hypothetical protein DL767_008243 [Monosporascus sp. MG133]|nr:hypothetical protein DL767_008243 [Monosporascus sp. MG133]
MSTPQPKFRVIIAGGGPVGLALGNMLAKADIDFLILERYPAIVTESGAGITLWPHGSRVLDSLELLESAEGNYGTLSKMVRLNLNGTVRREVPVFQWLEEQHGYPCMVFPRPRLTKLLYDGLGPENHSKVRAGVAVEDIETEADGVRVWLSDGSVETGSIIVGADGVHSTTRRIMQKLADKEAATTTADNHSSSSASFTEEPLLTTFECLYGSASPDLIPRLGIEKGEFYEGHGKDICTLLTSWDGGIHFGLFRRVQGQPTPFRHSFSAEETEAYKAAFADVHLAPGVKAREILYADPGHLVWTRLVQQPEGMARRWYHGRIVLVGDAALQITSAAGLGLNAALQSAVLLANGLHAVLPGAGAVTGPDPNPDLQTLTRVFAEYEEACRKESGAVADLSGRVIRGNTWESWSVWLMSEHLIPLLFGDRKWIGVAGREMVSKGRTLDCGKKTERSGSIPWTN